MAIFLIASAGDPDLRMRDLRYVAAVAGAFSCLGFVLIWALLPAWLVFRKLFRRGRFELATLFGLTAVVATELTLMRAILGDDLLRPEAIVYAILFFPFAIGIVGIGWILVREFFDVSLSSSHKRTTSPFPIQAHDPTYLEPVEKLDSDRIDQPASKSSSELTMD